MLSLFFISFWDYFFRSRHDSGMFSDNSGQILIIFDRSGRFFMILDQFWQDFSWFCTHSWPEFLQIFARFWIDFCMLAACRKGGTTFGKLRCKARFVQNSARFRRRSARENQRNARRSSPFASSCQICQILQKKRANKLRYPNAVTSFWGAAVSRKRSQLPLRVAHWASRAVRHQ